MKKMIPKLMIAIVISEMFGCHNASRPNAFRDPIDLSARDTAVRPQDNFFEYANGHWLKNARIPADRTFLRASDVGGKLYKRIKAILDSCVALKDAKEGSPAQQAGDLYASVMDRTAIEKAGLSPLRTNLDRIAAIESSDDILSEIARENLDGDWWWDWYSWGWNSLIPGSGQLCTLYVFTDDKSSDITRLQCVQGGLGLPDRTYYFKTDTASRYIIETYKNYIARVLSLSGDSKRSNADAGVVFSLEKKLADASRPPAELEDPEANYHLMSMKEMQELAPNLHWRELLHKMGIQTDTLLIRQPAFYHALSVLLKSEPLSVWKKYLSFHLVSRYAPWLSRPFEKANFAFEKVLSGRKTEAATWKRAAGLVNNSIGDALGRLYVERYFPPSSKAYMENMVINLKAAFREHIEQSDWMSNSTKSYALEKLNVMVAKIGYPDKWKDYSSVKIRRDSLITNLKRIGQWYYRYDMAKLHHPVDRSEWFMTPTTVNAYNNPTANDINFPAGILQPPFYFPHGDDAANYGAIGGVIGHEMIHGFDNIGRLYDRYGSLKNWWTKKDGKQFDQRAEQIVKQFDQYTVLDSVHLNGKLEEVENIADLGGRAVAYTAFQKTTEAYKDTLIDGLTPAQRFFLSFAQVWRVKVRPQFRRTLVNTNSHAPAMYRVNGPLSNIPAFYQAFHVKPGDKMYRPDSMRVKIW